MDIKELIAIDNEILGGQAVFKGTPILQFSNHFIPDLTRLANLLTA